MKLSTRGFVTKSILLDSRFVSFVPLEVRLLVYEKPVYARTRNIKSTDVLAFFTQISLRRKVVSSLYINEADDFRDNSVLKRRRRQTIFRRG